LAGPEQRLLRSKQHLGGLLDCRRIGGGALRHDRPVIELALEFGVEHLVRHFEQHRAGLARAQRVIGAPHQVGQFLHVMRQRRPLGHRAIDVGGAKHRTHILATERQAAGNHQERHILGIGLGDAGKGILDARPGLRGEYAVRFAAFDPRIAVSDADADALLPAQDRTDVDGGAGLDDRIAWVTRQEFGPLALENVGNHCSAIHNLRSPARRHLIRSS
jgi:hypothetical protein